MTVEDQQKIEAARKLLPSGYAVVPVRPTEKMLVAGCQAGPQHTARWRATLGEILAVEWSAMIQAAE